MSRTVPENQLKQDNRTLKKYLKQLTVAVKRCVDALDVEMEKPSTPERGARIAKITNALEIQNDQARYFGLGVDYRKDKK